MKVKSSIYVTDLDLLVDNHSTQRLSLGPDHNLLDGVQVLRPPQVVVGGVSLESPAQAGHQLPDHRI